MGNLRMVWCVYYTEVYDDPLGRRERHEKNTQETETSDSEEHQ